MALRPYQEESLVEIKNLYAQGVRKVLLHLATGGGKTVVFSELLKQVDAKGNECAMMVRGRQLVDQASKRLFRENVNHGVIMANHWNKNMSARVQVCSIDTLMARDYKPKGKLLVIDEAHLFTSPKCVEFIESFPRDTFILSVTATPYTRESLRHLAETVVSPTSVAELIDLGFLVGPRYFAPSIPDLKGVRLVSNDYSASELEQRMSTLTGDIVKHWIELGENRSTICFAVNINHSLSIVAQFKAAGIPAEHIEGNTSFAEREAAIGRLQRGEIKILSNVGVLCTGVDIPFVSCLIMARPTKSYNLFIQQAGRGTRPCPEIGKKDFILLDHAGNVLRHGFITETRDVDLDGKKKKESIPSVKQCKQCYIIYEGPQCTGCGHIEIVKNRADLIVEVDDGVLEEIKEFAAAAEITQYVNKLKSIRHKKGYKSGWVYYKVQEEYGEEIADRLFPTMRQRQGFKRGTYNPFK